MNTLLQLLTSGLALGAIYALVALGFVAIYRSSSVFNFAHGEFLTLGAFSMITAVKLGLPWPIAVLAAMTITGSAGAAVERFVLRPLIGRPVFVTIIVTIFIGMIMRSLILVGWGVETRGMPTPWDPTAAVTIGPVSVLYNAVATVAAGAITLALFFTLLHKTRLGVAMQATASDQETALALGIPVGKIFALTWFIAGATAAIAGICLGLFPRTVDANLGFIALRAFPAVIVGGLDSVGGTVLAGLMLGLLEVLAQGYVNPHLGAFGNNFHAVFPYIVMVGFLIVRPYGLFGSADVERV